MTYGLDSGRNVAVCRDNRTTGMWDACEVNGSRYCVVTADELTEDELDRAYALAEVERVARAEERK